ncbi:hypothetical protein ZIOFF_007620 [Zingiber officinale]|uniref:serine C-palmitoyltransferase n=1 Tax=Zingiber officinale TaxID=94328 RepID=A0A8J5IE38_ZINOF|nr:hypothetical protein ZIOFF_007620 [Zingiber officinale]
MAPRFPLPPIPPLALPREIRRAVRLTYLTALATLFGYGIFFVFGLLRDLFRRLLLDRAEPDELKGYAPICPAFEDFYTRRIYHRIQVRVFSNGTASGDRLRAHQMLGSMWWSKAQTTTTKHHNFYATSSCCVSVMQPDLHHIQMPQVRTDHTTTLALQPGMRTARLLFVTRSRNTHPVLAVLELMQGGLVISDSFNHNSIVSGARASGAAVQVFQHNSPSHLEEVLREQIVKGQPGTAHEPWRKIMVIVEGIYSMEGELCKLPEIVAICKKYKAYIYLDEARSIGAVGKSGRGVCELLGVDPTDVDIMMGTFTKSFGSCGGYIAASEEIIQYLKYACPAHLYATSMSPPAVQQVISAIKVVIGEDRSNRGAKKLAKIRVNSNFFRSELKKMGFVVLGDNDSPIMATMLYNLAKFPAFSRACLRQNVSDVELVAVVIAAYPATPVLLARARICISASHSKEDLITGLKVIGEVGGLVGAKCLPAEPEKAKKLD